MSTGGWAAALIALSAAVLLGIALTATLARLRRLETRLGTLERRLANDVAGDIAAARQDARAAAVTAQRAALAVGIEDPPPRLAFEAVSGPIVKAVAFGAGARRAVARLARLRRPPRGTGPGSVDRGRAR